MFIAEKIDALVQVRMEKESGDAFLRNIQDIARELGISTSYCNKVFKRIYKMSPRQYLSFKKLHEAKSLLLQSNLKLEQISNLLGYHDVAHFSRQFKKWSGMTPRQYAKQNTINVNI
jgi:AraC-like DNA-binding protein